MKYRYYASIALKLIRQKKFHQLIEYIKLYIHTVQNPVVTCKYEKFSNYARLYPDNHSQPRIAIHAHIYYSDLAKTVLKSISNIPSPYALFVSVSDNHALAEVSASLACLKNKPEKIDIRLVENFGRNVAPLLVSFSRDLLEYDYLCHIHSKKSLYTGNNRQDWLRHLLYNLLGSKKIIKSNIAILLKNKKVGLIYPETHEILPYWAHTWLSNKKIADDFCHKLKLNFDPNEYMDAPLGTMFWARIEALKPLLSLEMTKNDFPAENGQNDGTLAHVVERILVPLCEKNGFSYCVINADKDILYHSHGVKNLHQYHVKNSKSALVQIQKYQLVTFDIFDTLLIRPILEPEAVLHLIELLIKKRLMKPCNFFEVRKKAEDKARQKYNRDVSINDIYTVIHEDFIQDHELVEKIKQIEIETELKLAKPRPSVIALYNSVKKGTKRIIVSDMYLTGADIEKLLNKIEIKGYANLYVSSETNLRKDTGDFWKYFKSNYDFQSHLHVGDNEHSDIQLPTDMGVNTSHVMSIRNLFRNSPYYRVRSATRLNLAENILFGIAAERVFSNPFPGDTDTEHKTIKRPDTLGYFVFGPILIYFIIWLAKRVKEDNIKQILFLSREGYLLKKLFEIVRAKLAEKDGYFNQIKTDYLLVSRRAVGVAGIKNENDAFELLDSPYTGSIPGLLINRYGLEPNALTHVDRRRIIDLATDKEEVRNLLQSCMPGILSTAEKERKAYTKYIQQFISSNSENVGLVDAGYSGTIQKGLTKIVGKNFKGYYLVTNQRARDVSTTNACYGEFVNEQSSVPIYEHLLFLESLLTSPQAQFVKISDEETEMKTIFRSNKEISHYDYLEKAQLGTQQYFFDVLKYYDDVLFELLDARIDTLQMVFQQIALHPHLLDVDVRSKLLVEDFYTSEMVRKVFFFS